MTRTTVPRLRSRTLTTPELTRTSVPAQVWVITQTVPSELATASSLIVRTRPLLLILARRALVRRWRRDTVAARADRAPARHWPRARRQAQREPMVAADRSDDLDDAEPDARHRAQRPRAALDAGADRHLGAGARRVDLGAEPDRRVGAQRLEAAGSGPSDARVALHLASDRRLLRDQHDDDLAVGRGGVAGVELDAVDAGAAGDDRPAAAHGIDEVVTGAGIDDRGALRAAGPGPHVSSWTMTVGGAARAER